jgi:hypothetical protein
MKKFYLLFAVFALFSCSADNEEILHETGTFENLNAVVEIDGCESESFSFGTAGSIEVINDTEYLYVSVVAGDSYSLAHAKLHVANSEDAFPTVGKGNLPPGQMDHKMSFDPVLNSYTFKLPISDFEGCVYIASQSEFTDSTSSGTYWAGDIAGQSGNWYYFEYCIQTCESQDPICDLDAGPDNSKNITFSEAGAIPSWDEVRKLYLSLLADGVSRDGTFDPSIWDIINNFNERGVGGYSTTYTITEGDCSDTVELTINVVADPAEDPTCDLDAGPNNSKTITYSEAEAIPSWDEVRKLYLSLLANGVSRDGTFDPSIWNIINDFNQRGVGTYTTTYTITEGDCTDSVELSIIVVPDNS